MKELINESFELSCFKEAQEYFYKKPQLDNELISLFKLADADEYIRKAKQENPKKRIKDNLILILKQIYKSI